MIRQVLSVTAAGLFLALASACASTATQDSAAAPSAAPAEQTAAPAQAAPAPAAAPASAAAPAQVASAASSKKEFHPDDMVCRIYEVTGTRINKQRVCKTRQQWVDDARAAQESLRTMTNQNAAQPGGDQLITGGTPK